MGRTRLGLSTARSRSSGSSARRSSRGAGSERRHSLILPSGRNGRCAASNWLGGGRCVVTMLGTVSALPEIRELSGDEAFVWDGDFLTADGWVEKNGGWVLEADGIELPSS